jgi:superfamily II DNA helicase RecQ
VDQNTGRPAKEPEQNNCLEKNQTDSVPEGSLTRAAYSTNETTPIEFIMKETAVPAKRKGKRKGAVAAKRTQAKRPETPGRPEARRRGVPAFRILSDQALRAMATRRPGTVRELLAIPGIGITTVEKYARQFYRILQKSGLRCYHPITAPLKQP